MAQRGGKRPQDQDGCGGQMQLHGVVPPRTGKDARNVMSGSARTLHGLWRKVAADFLMATA